MKVKITKMPVRIDGERYEIGRVLDVTEKTYETIKSICIIVDEAPKKKKQKTKEEDVVDEVEISEYDSITKEDILLKLSELGIGADPSLKKKELYNMLVSAKNE